VNARRLWILAAWSAAFFIALLLDRPVATWVYQSGLGVELKSHWRWLIRIARLPGNFLTFTLVVSTLLFYLGPRWWPAAAFVLVSGVFSGSNSFVKWMVGRRRPFQGDMFGLHPFAGSWAGLFGPNLSFPSGDVCLAAATAGSLAILFPPWRGLCAAVVLVVAVERVTEGAHYPSDVVAGAALGWLLAHLAWRLLGRPQRPGQIQNFATKP
jgi:membrane-associated phospholipid phosphatase